MFPNVNRARFRFIYVIMAITVTYYGIRSYCHVIINYHFFICHNAYT